MTFRHLALSAFFLLLCAAEVGYAQAPTTPLNERQALSRQHQGDFDYLLGDWEFTGVRKTANSADEKLHGFASAVRFPKGPEILVQDRLLNDDGSTFFESSTLMAYNAALDQWEVVSTGDGGPGVGLQDRGIAHRVGNEMHTEQHFGSMSPKPTIWHIRHYDIQPDRYSMVAERSTDGGRTWEGNYERIEMRRIGPARSLEPLIPDSPRAKTMGQ
jgi:hypothetical protein